MAALAALLVMVAWNMSEVKHFVHTLKTAPRSDIVVLLTCFGLTVVFDMVVSVTVGVMLAALLFMKRMAELTGARVIEGDHPGLVEKPPAGVVIYEIAGPLFFGAAQKAMSELHDIHARVRAVVLEMSSVPAMDATGTVALESALQRLAKQKVLVVLAGVQAQPKRVLERAHIVAQPGVLAFAADLKSALVVADEKARARG
jgi:SulP family sulfate permease